MTNRTAFIPAGNVKYDLDAASIDINEMIEALEELRDLDGITHIAGLSGNYRGAKYIKLGNFTTDFDDEN